MLRSINDRLGVLCDYAAGEHIEPMNIDELLTDAYQSMLLENEARMRAERTQHGEEYTF